MKNKNIIKDNFFKGIHAEDWHAVQREMRYWHNRFDYTYQQWHILCKLEYIKCMKDN